MTPTEPTNPSSENVPEPAEPAPEAGSAAAFSDDLPSTADRPGKEERVGATLLDRYKLLEEIGEGGMGTVFLAQQIEPVKRLVAVKVIKAGMDSKAVLARFEAERQALALMDHPNIARVFDAGTTPGGRPFFVMELVKGVPLTRFCDERRLTPRQRLELFVPVCQAIQHAHLKGVIHRDIKPSNVLVALYDDKAVPKVIDFGVAKATGGTLTDQTLVTGFGAVVGTPEYMSPEQASLNNLDIDTRSDVYALGVLLYELLTGSTPVDRKSLGKAALAEILRIVREDEAPRPSQKLSTADTLPKIAANRGVDPKQLTSLLRSELDWIVMKALEKDRTRRYETANGFAADVLRYLAGEPVQAHPPSSWYRLGKFVRRNRVQVIAAGLVAGSLVLGIIGTTIGLLREAAANRRAQGRLAQIERGTELLANLLRGIKPENETRGTDAIYTNLRERAEKAADELTSESIADPLVTARLQTVLGDTLRTLGSFKKAIALLELAHATRQTSLGEDHPDTLATQHALGMALLEDSQLEPASQQLEQVQERRIRMLGSDHPDTLSTRQAVALALYDKGKPQEAATLLERIWDDRKRVLGAEAPETLETMNDLALAYSELDRTQDAIRLHTVILEASLRIFGKEHPETLTTMNNLGQMYNQAGRLVEAKKLLQETRDIQLRRLGAEHPLTLMTLNNLALAHGGSNELKEAMALIQMAYDMKRKRFGLEHLETLETLNSLAWIKRRAGQYADAISLARLAADTQARLLGENHPSTIGTLTNLATTYWMDGRIKLALDTYETACQRLERADFSSPRAAYDLLPSAISSFEEAGDFARAEHWCRKLVFITRRDVGAESIPYAQRLVALGMNLTAQKKWAEAATILAEGLTLSEKIQPDAWTTFNTQSLLGEALLAQKKFAEAEPLLVKGYEGIKAREKSIPPQVASPIPESLDRLIALYEALKKPDEVKKYKQLRAMYPRRSPFQPK